MNKDYKQHLADLQSGLAQIKKVIKETKDLKKYQKAKLSKDIQEARIEFFKIGYNLRNRELKEQIELNSESEGIPAEVLEDISALEEQTEL